MTKRLKKALTMLALAFVVSALGLVSGTAFEAALTPDQVQAMCENQKCLGSDDCQDSSAEGCDNDAEDCTTYKCGPE